MDSQKEKISRCNGCGAQIVWLKTAAGKNMCVDADSYVDGKLYVHGLHRPHWATCPAAHQFKRKNT